MSKCISVHILPWKKCSFDACWSSFPAALLWLFFCRGAFPLSVSLFPWAEGVFPVWPNCWFNKPVGVRHVTVSSRILLSWNIYKTCQTYRRSVWCFKHHDFDSLYVTVPLHCVSSPPPPPLVALSPILSSTSPVLSGIAPAQKHYPVYIKFCMHKDTQVL